MPWIGYVTSKIVLLFHTHSVPCRRHVAKTTVLLSIFKAGVGAVS